MGSSRYDDLPQGVVECTKRSILDTLGVMVAATTTGEGALQVVESTREFGGSPESTIIGFGDRVPCYLAAFANGALCHCQDYDDIHDAALCHPTAATLPAALAMAERLGGVSGRQLIVSIAVCSDLVCRLGLAITRPFAEHGWMTAALFGYFGGAAAAGKLLGLDRECMVDALGLALCQAGGTQEMGSGTGSMVRGIRDGFGQKAGVLSALLAGKGVTGPKEVMEGKWGFYNLYFGGQYERSQLTADLGERYEGVNVSIKPWPACRTTHPYLEAALWLAQEHHIRAEEVESVTLGVGKLAQSLCEPREQRWRPSLAVDAKYSLPFVVAKALLYGKVVTADFLPDGLGDEISLALARRITHRLDSDLEGRGVPPAAVEIRLRNGRVFSRRVDVPYGHPSNPISDDDLGAKFRDCARYSVNPLSEAALEGILRRVSTLEDEQDVRFLIPQFGQTGSV